MSAPLEHGGEQGADFSVKTATREEENAVAGAVIAAFLTDPLARWLLPEAHQSVPSGPKAGH
jgi:hypothetical protein